MPLDPDQWAARGQTLEVLGRRIFFVDEGPRDATTLLVLHGYPTSSHDYIAALQRLTPRFRVVVHDHLGFGLSAKPSDYSYSMLEQAEFALGLWRSLGITEGVLVAHDYGTSVATEILARRQRLGVPVKLRGVSLSNGSMVLHLAQLRLIQRLLRSPITGPTVARLASKSTFSKNLRATLARPETLTDADIDTGWTLLTRDSGSERLPTITSYLDERVRFHERWIGAFRALDIPALLLWGKEDPVAVAAIAQTLSEALPSARLRWLEGIGHYPMIEDPDAWCGALVEFVDSLA